MKGRIQNGGEADPLAFYRREKIRKKLISKRERMRRRVGCENYFLLTNFMNLAKVMKSTSQSSMNL